MSGLDDLLDAARHADKGSRILLRDEIAAHGDQAIGPMVGWLKDPRLGAFGVRVLQVIAADAANRGSVIAALSAVSLSGLSPEVAGDLRQALAELRPAVGPRSSTGAPMPSRAKGRDAWRERGGGSILEERFHDSMLGIYWLAGDATGYWASYFLRGVRNKGGVAEARDLLRKTGTSPGFERLKAERRLDLSMEAIVTRPEYAGLFTPLEIEIAEQRLDDAGYGLGDR